MSAPLGPRKWSATDQWLSYTGQPTKGFPVWVLSRDRSVSKPAENSGLRGRYGDFPLVKNEQCNTCMKHSIRTFLRRSEDRKNAPRTAQKFAPEWNTLPGPWKGSAFPIIVVVAIGARSWKPFQIRRAGVRSALAEQYGGKFAVPQARLSRAQRAANGGTAAATDLASTADTKTGQRGRRSAGPAAPF